MFGLEVIVRVNPYRRMEFLQAVRMQLERGERSTECPWSGLFEDVGEPNRFLWVERWTGIDPLNAHMRTDHFRSLLGAFSVVGSIEGIHLADLKSAG